MANEKGALLRPLCQAYHPFHQTSWADRLCCTSCGKKEQLLGTVQPP